VFLVYCRQPLPYRITEGLPVTRAQSPGNGHNSRTFMSGCAKEWWSPTCATDYSYLKATIGSIFVALRAGT